MGFRVHGLGIRVKGSGFRGLGVGSRVDGSGFTVQVQKEDESRLSTDEPRPPNESRSHTQPIPYTM